ncbi:hypothetical protein Micbo1qcDRAFT_207658 [Microdochium bolleyi]|uniref:Uncharacterized protein n=1 Tax=Microdochium bolleyi TaxID=196109 RepID=A0A136ISZ8_9PEZI|nr:hypothetical protein Micbo1qcDRAFT_207658 [Microdochium bolleyi]
MQPTNKITLMLLLAAACATTATAIDIHGYARKQCAGAYLSCRDARPGECCSFGGARFASMKWDLIPAGSRIECHVFKGSSDGGSSGSHCTNPARKPLVPKKTRKTVCVSAGRPYRGGKYELVKRAKRGEDENEEANEVVEGDRDAKCVRADTLTLEDGTTFDLRHLDETSFEKLATLLQ